MLPTSRGRALPRIGIALGTVLSGLAAMGAPAHAAGSTLYGTGLHIATGALVDPAGRTWVSDHNGGFCRVTAPTETRPATLEHPDRPGRDDVARTCLGGLLPDAGLGPDAAGAPALHDPTPEWEGDEIALIPDGSSPSSEVVRARWNKDTQLFEFQDTITMSGDRGRPNAVSIGPDGNVYVSFQREGTIQRIVDPGADVPTVEVVSATSDGRGAGAVAAGRDADGELAVYVAEAAGLRVIRPGAGTGSQPAPFAIGGAIGALHYDLARDVLYAGTADAAAESDLGADEVVRVDVKAGTVDERHATGFTVVGGLGAARDGHLFVLDDPAIVTPGEPLGLGRLFHVGLPAAHVTAGPTGDTGPAARDARFTADSTPTFTVEGDGLLECRLSGGTLTPAWGDCGPEGRFAVGTALPDGSYVLSVRAQGGLPEAHPFTVDTRAPLKPRVLRPGGTVSSSPWFEFQGEAQGAFACAFDGEAAEACTPGRTRTFPEAGQHTLTITVTDRAGNVSEASDPATFTVDPALPFTPAPGIGAGPPSHRGSSRFTEGLHIATGALVDPNNRVWVADHNGGFCRVTQPGEDGPGAIEHPTLPDGTETATCLGGLLPGAGTGPDAAGQPVLVDPTPARPGDGDEIALIPDGASHSSEVVRASFNPDTGLFEYKDVVTMVGDRARPVAASLGPDGAVYVVFQRAGTIQRIANPAGANPTAQVVGQTSDGRGASAVAAGRNAEGRLTVYVGEAAGLTELRPNAALPPITTASFGLPAGTAVGALAYDLARDELYAGTANGTTQADAGRDTVHKVTIASGAVEAGWLEGYSMIGGLGLRSDGVLFVLDDPTLLDPAEPLGTGRLFHVGLPAAHLVRGPLLADGTAAADPAHVADTRPAFVVEASDGAAQCRLRGPEGLDTGWVACGEAFRPDSELAEGEHVLTVRAVDGEVTGLVEAHRFSVDTQAPGKPAITSPTTRVVSATPWFAFASEAGARFECRWDGTQAWMACAPGRTRSFAANGDHTLQIRAIDRAGNVSVPSDTLAFSARGRIGAVTIDAGPSGATQATTAEFRFSADAVDVQFACRLDGGSFTSCASPKAYRDLAEGDHVFEVRGRDAVGNLSPVARRTFTVDRTAPVATIGGVAGAVTGPDVTFTIGADEAAELRCSVDGGEFGPCTERVDLTGLADGTHTLQVVATDAAGNEGEVLTRTFTVRRPAASAPAVDPPAQGGTTGAPAPAPTPEPGITVTELATGALLTIRIVDIDRRVDLDKLREAGVQVEVIPAEGTKLIRFRVFKLRGGGRARGAQASRKLVTTIYRTAPKKPGTIRLTRRELRKLTAGRYVLEVTPGTSRRDLGRATTTRISVTR